MASKSVVSTSYEHLVAAEKLIKLAVEAFSSSEVLKSSDSYLFGMVRLLHDNSKNVMSVVGDTLGKEKSVVKTKPVSPKTE